MQLYLILGASIVLFVLLSMVIYRKYGIRFKPENNQINYRGAVNLAGSGIRRISSRPFLFGLEDNLVSDEDFYFDETNFYAINNQENRKAIFPLADIVELRKTSVVINNHRVWQIIIEMEGKNAVIFKFTHNYSIWNKDFYAFYERLKQINPAVVKSNWSLWTM